MQEIWKEIKGYEGYYQISNLGKVKSLCRKIQNGNKFNLRKEIILKNSINSVGYYTVTLYKNNKSTVKLVHVLIAETFIPNPESKPQVNHIDGVKLNISVENLEWVTRSENIQHAYDTGLTKNKGESHYLSKITVADKSKIKELVKSGISQRKIAKQFGVNQSQISRINADKAWN